MLTYGLVVVAVDHGHAFLRDTSWWCDAADPPLYDLDGGQGLIHRARPEDLPAPRGPQATLTPAHGATP